MCWAFIDLNKTKIENIERNLETISEIESNHPESMNNMRHSLQIMNHDASDYFRAHEILWPIGHPNNETLGLILDFSFTVIVLMSYLRF